MDLDCEFLGVKIIKERRWNSSYPCWGGEGWTVEFIAAQMLKEFCQKNKYNQIKMVLHWATLRKMLTTEPGTEAALYKCSSYLYLSSSSLYWHHFEIIDKFLLDIYVGLYKAVCTISREITVPTCKKFIVIYLEGEEIESETVKKKIVSLRQCPLLVQLESFIKGYSFPNGLKTEIKIFKINRNKLHSNNLSLFNNSGVIKLNWSKFHIYFEYNNQNSQ